MPARTRRAVAMSVEVGFVAQTFGIVTFAGILALISPSMLAIDLADLVRGLVDEGGWLAGPRRRKADGHATPPGASFCPTRQALRPTSREISCRFGKESELQTKRGQMTNRGRRGVFVSCFGLLLP